MMQCTAFFAWKARCVDWLFDLSSKLRVVTSFIKRTVLAGFVSLGLIVLPGFVSAEECSKPVEPWIGLQLATSALAKKTVNKRVATQPASINGSTSEWSESRGASEQKPFTVTVSKAQYLPPAMYGQWSVTGEILESNAPEQFNPKLSDIWILEREGDQIVISNPATGASANISVDKVEGDTATFHRMGQPDRNMVLEESPTITVRNDVMTGVMTNRKFKVKNGTLIPVAYVKYQLEAQRIGGARTRFMPAEGNGTSQQEPDIEIDEIKFAPGKKRPFQY
jgi:hypothetical protein